MVAIGLLALVGMAGLALDMGHLYLNRARLQNAVDAAALSGAQTLNALGNGAEAVAAATTDARTAFRKNANDDPDASPGNAELQGIADDAVTVEFSDTVDPFNPGGANPRFVRVAVAAVDFQWPTWLIRVLGDDFQSSGAGGSAVAGPISVCPDDIVPVVACTGAGATAPDYGYVIGQDYNLLPKNANDVGPGNFKLLSLPDCGTGGACVREKMAGSFSGCLPPGSTQNVLTQPGQLQGPVAQGLNTRLDCPPSGRCAAGLDATVYPPDIYTAIPLTYTQYKDALSDPSTVFNPRGIEHRRELTVPFANCDGTLNGRSDITILGLRCFFLKDEVQQGNTDSRLNAEYIGSCPATGGTIGGSAGGPGPWTVILYKDFTAGVVDS